MFLAFWQSYIWEGAWTSGSLRPMGVLGPQCNPTHDFPLGGSWPFCLWPSPLELVSALVLSLALGRGPSHVLWWVLWGVLLVPGHAGDAPTNRGRSCGHHPIFFFFWKLPCFHRIVSCLKAVTASLRHLCSLLAEILVYFSSVNMPFRR